MHTTAAHLDEEENVEPFSQIVSTVKKSTANGLWRCARTNSRHVIFPRLPAGPTRGPEPPADGRR